MTDSLPKGHRFRTWNTTDARDSTNFAFETTRLALIPTLSFEAAFARDVVADQMAVYSLKEKRRIFTIKVREEDDDCALSPDGSLFATLSNGWARVYKLP